MRPLRTLLGRLGLSAVLAAATLSGDAARADPLLSAAVDFSGQIAFLATKAPGFILVGVRNGEVAVSGFGEISDKSGKTPDGDTLFRIGSVSKVFCGETLASMALDGKLRFEDRLQDRLGYDVQLPARDGRAIRLIDLATQSSGLPREVPRAEAPPENPFASNTKEAQIADLKTRPLLFAPGSATFYSNFGFDLLGAALANAGGKPYADLLKERVLDPLGMKDTVFNLRPGDEARAMQGHNFDGAPMVTAPTPTSIECAGGLYTTARDMARFMVWHLDRTASSDSDLRLLDHAAYLYRDGLTSALGVDDAGEMDAMGLAWVINLPKGVRPLMLQKTGGLQGSFSYLAIAPGRGVAAFFVMNAFNLGGFAAAVAATNGLVAQLAAR